MERMEKSVEATKRNFVSVRTGRANPAVLDRIEVDYYGALTPLKTIAGCSAPDAMTIVIQPYDKGAIQDIEKAIMQSDLGMTPMNDGQVIRLTVPQLTSERRKEMVKVVGKLGEEGKVAIRNVRRDAIKKFDRIKKDGDLGEDAHKAYTDGVQELTDNYCKEIDELVKSKEKELTTV